MFNTYQNRILATFENLSISDLREDVRICGVPNFLLCLFPKCKVFVSRIVLLSKLPDIRVLFGLNLLLKFAVPLCCDLNSLFLLPILPFLLGTLLFSLSLTQKSVR